MHLKDYMRQDADLKEHQVKRKHTKREYQKRGEINCQNSKLSFLLGTKVELDPAVRVQSQLNGPALRRLMESEEGQADSAAPPRRAGHLKQEGSA